ncbi:MAG: M15 family metallopeptidase [Saprospiraceae bacterium]|nr:M15 family metallopeptidase [Saprospiraceae bacterium]
MTRSLFGSLSALSMIWGLLFCIACNSSADADSSPPLPPEDPQFTADYLMGHFDPADHPDFVLIDSAYADRSGMYLRQDAYTEFLKMHAAAASAGIDLQIRSATRNFVAQKGIWERKWTGETKIENGLDASVAYPDPVDRALAILKYSSMPGTSRHHWGTDIDLNAFVNSWFESGEGLVLYTWLVEHAHQFGYCQPYTEKGDARPHGYEEEKWHWSFEPVARTLTELAADSLDDARITGFLGSETAPQIGVVDKYVLGINPACRN